MKPAELLKDRIAIEQDEAAGMAYLANVVKAVEVIRRRFAAGQPNLARYCALVDEWDIYDNSGVIPRLIKERSK